MKKGRNKGYSMECKHEDFIANVRVERMEDIGKFAADVTVKCSQCGQPFKFLGLPGGSLMDGAAVSVDGTEARLAIAPQDAIPEYIPYDMFSVVPKPRAIDLLERALLADDKHKQWYLWQIAKLLKIDTFPVIAQLNADRGIAPHE